MCDYKQLNKEVIDANRALKQLVTTLQTELVMLKADRMEQHRQRVEAEFNCRERFRTLIKSFLTSLREIDADINIMEYIQSVDANLVGVSDQSGFSKCAKRRSTQLVSDFRRASVACRQQSVVQMSPTRRVQEKDATMIEEESDMDLENSINPDNIIDVENDDDTIENEALGCIDEGTEEELEMESNMYMTPKQNPLRDVSNKIMENRPAKRKESDIRRRGKQGERLNACENSIDTARDLALDYSQTPTQFDLDNDIEDELVSSVQRSLHLTIGRAESNTRVDKQNEYIVCNEKPIRNLVVRLQRLHELPPNIMVYNATEDTIVPHDLENLADITKENDGTETSLGLPEYSMGNFLEKPCSTPCHNGKAQSNTSALVETMAVSAACTDEVGSTPSVDNSTLRPSRSCIPRNLAEPKLNTKLRNASKVKRSKSKKR
ncbi:shugoshin [Eurosta solidaginis]|uniref:shugoshin n=1 Tax=Eurosta solidaginis TaxID=178769 RepID=UPI0035306A52